MSTELPEYVASEIKRALAAEDPRAKQFILSNSFLHDESYYANPIIVSALLNAGLDPTFGGLGPGRSLCHMTAAHFTPEVFAAIKQKLPENPDRWAAQETAEMPSHRAAFLGNAESLKAWMQAEAEDANPPFAAASYTSPFAGGGAHETHLHIAVHSKESREKVAYLLREVGYNPHIRNQRGETAYDLASNADPIVKAMLEWAYEQTKGKPSKYDELVFCDLPFKDMPDFRHLEKATTAGSDRTVQSPG